MDEQEKPSEPQSEWRDREGHKGHLVVAILLSVSFLMGAFIFWRYVISQRHLADAYHTIAEQGAELTVEGCVDAVLGWMDRCEAMKGLCDMTTPGMMLACLTARDRREYCADVAGTTATTHFGYDECERRRLSRTREAVCAQVYRVIDAHCQTYAQDPAP